MNVTIMVGKYIVPIHNFLFLSIVTFSRGAHGKEERGDFAFWTIVLKRGKRRRIIARALCVRDAGERFRRIGIEARSAKDADDRFIYAGLWRAMGAGKNIKFIRPATLHEIKRWMGSHKADAAGVVRASIGGKLVRVK